ncbi:MAG: ATP-binding cassette domain-containing protein [Pseudomonadota bacterium]
MIEFQDLGFGYTARERVLERVSLVLPDGSFHVLTGASGAGKTTVLKLCHLALRPSQGDLRVFGQSVQGLSRDAVTATRRRIGIVHQDCQFLDHLSVRQNIALPRYLRGETPDHFAEDLSDLIAWVGLEKRKDAMPPELSSGERQRAALARAVIASPELILADEPTGNVDPRMGQHLLSLILELNRLGKTVLVATHDLALIRAARDAVPVRLLRVSSGAIAVGATL